MLNKISNHKGLWITVIVLVIVIAGIAAVGYQSNQYPKNPTGTYVLTRQDGSANNVTQHMKFTSNKKVVVTADGTKDSQTGTYKMTSTKKGTFTVTLGSDTMDGSFDSTHKNIILVDPKTKIPVVFNSSKKLKSADQISGSFAYTDPNMTGAGGIKVTFSGNDVGFTVQNTLIGASNYAIRDNKVYVTGFGVLKIKDQQDLTPDGTTFAKV